MNSLIATLLMLLEHAPAATPAAVKTVADIAHGTNDGQQKVLKVLDDVRAVVVAAITGQAPSVATTNTGGVP
jgi:hypothetical protein